MTYKREYVFFGGEFFVNGLLRTRIVIDSANELSAE